MPFESNPSSPAAAEELIEEEKLLVAYRTHGMPMKIVRAEANRPWMDAFHTSFANRCLPMRIANQDGWFLLNPSPVQVLWNGGRKQSDVSIEVLEGTTTPVLSHFGHGVITWWLPYLFRTPTGYNMHVRGPVNYCKDGIVPLDALVEADWSVASFPMSWKLTRIGHPVRFEKDEPICMISPVRRGETESFSPLTRELASNPALRAGFDGWSKSRHAHNESLRHPNPPAKWQKHYFVGTHPSSSRQFRDHQVRLLVRPFPELPAAAEKAVQAPAAAPAKMAAVLGCPWPGHAAGLPSVATLRASAEEDSFFERLEELQRFATRWLAGGEDRADLAAPQWSYQFAAAKHAFLSCKPDPLFPADLLGACMERLNVWGAGRHLGRVRSLQLSLFVHGCFRIPSRLSHGTYFLLPLFERRSNLLRGGRLVVDPVASSNAPDAAKKTRHLSLSANTLLAFRSESFRVGVEELRGSMSPREGLLLLEGSFE